MAPPHALPALSLHTEALGSGSPRLPAAMFRLLVELEARGQPVQVPRCARCGQRRVLRSLGEGGRICVSCARWARARPCTQCGTVAQVAVANDGNPICASCYARDPRRHETCSDCGQLRKVNSRLPDGTALCSSCHQKPRRTCAFCGKEAVVAARTADGPACPRCYDTRWRTPGLCGGCGQVAVIKRRARGGAPDLCRRCATSPIAQCSSCGRERPCVRAGTGSPVCQSCRPARHAPLRAVR